jgi:hypothetical protein
MFRSERSLLNIRFSVCRAPLELGQFPLLSKCQLLQSLCADSDAVELRDFPGGADAFEACAKFCYGVAITVGAHNVVPLRCAAGRLGMTEAAHRAKLDAFLASCLLRSWRDALAVLCCPCRDEGKRESDGTHKKSKITYETIL